MKRRRPTVDDLHRRLDAIAAAAGASLTPAELDELAELRADFDRRFPGVRHSLAAIDDLTDEQLEDLLEHQRGNDGAAQRLHELTQRNRSPAEIERDRIRGEMIAAMSDAELEQWILAQTRPSDLTSPGRRSRFQPSGSA